MYYDNLHAQAVQPCMTCLQQAQAVCAPATALLDCPALLISHAQDTMSLVQLSTAHSSNANWEDANEHPHRHDEMMLQQRHCKG
jgi:hypothetical protein